MLVYHILRDLWYGDSHVTVGLLDRSFDVPAEPANVVLDLVSYLFSIWTWLWFKSALEDVLHNSM